MKIMFCGGAGEVGASCFLLQMDGKNILLDCGIRMSAGGKDSLPDFRMIQEAGGIDVIFISHAHLDHTGSLPIISREYPEALIYMTHATKDLVRVLLYDSLKIMDRQEGEIPIYAEKHVMDMLERIVCFSPEHPIVPFKDRDIVATFYSAGHILGASGIYIQSKEGNIFYSGDISTTNQYTVNGATIPKLRPDVMLVESTYGDKMHANRQMEEERLVKMVEEVIERGGKILIPAFALGRAQEVILILKRAKNRGELKDIKVYVDGMVKDICRVYSLNPNYLKNSLAKRVWRGQDIFFDDDIIQVENREMREEIVTTKTPCCIISSSGMLTGGPSQWYASKLITDENNHIAITGYQDEEAPGRLLLNLLAAEESEDNERKNIALGDVRVPVRASVGSYSLSAHSDRGEILGLCHTLAPRKLFLVHGEEKATVNLGREIQSEIRGQVYVANNGDSYEIDIRKPRKQIGRRRIPSLKREGLPQKDDIELLWKHVKDNGGERFAFSGEDLLLIWNDALELSDKDVRGFMAILTESKYFTPDNRRPFLFRLVPEHELVEENGPMEVNRMLGLAEQFFPSESGLYKKGARFEEKVTLLYFNFPPVALKLYKEKMDEFQELTGWTVEVNEEYNLEAVENALYRVLPEGNYMEGNMSFYREEGLVRIAVDGLQRDKMGQIATKFKELTGLDLVLDDKVSKTVSPPPAAKTGQMEQNQAFALVDKAFAGAEHRVYKKSLKRDGATTFMELSFITPQVGKLYDDIIRQLENKTGWYIRINPNPNQNELTKLVRRLLERSGLYLKKNPSVYQGEKEIRVIPAGDWDKSVFAEVQNEFLASTGYKVTL